MSLRHLVVTGAALILGATATVVAAPSAHAASAWTAGAMTVAPGNGAFDTAITLTPAGTCPAGTDSWDAFLAPDRDVDPSTSTDYLALTRPDGSTAFGDTAGPLPTVGGFTLAASFDGATLQDNMGVAGTYRIGLACQIADSGTLLAAYYTTVVLAGPADAAPSWTAASAAAAPANAGSSAVPGAPSAPGAGDAAAPSTATSGAAAAPTSAAPTASAAPSSASAASSSPTPGVATRRTPGAVAPEAAAPARDAGRAAWWWLLLVVPVAALATLFVRRRRARTTDLPADPTGGQSA